MKRVVLLTSSELRHDFFRKAFGLAAGMEVVRTYREGLEKSLVSLIDTSKPESESQSEHLKARAQSEDDFFGPFVRLVPDHTQAIPVPSGAINTPECHREIQALSPDLLVAYGCSLVKEPLISAFTGRFLNVHLGLSPYYRGSGTNFWPLVNGEPEYVGATFMHIDAGVDTGNILHQIRARVVPGDTPHQIGNRLIADMVPAYIHIVRHSEHLGSGVQLPRPAVERYFRKKDFSTQSVEKLYRNFATGLVDRYLCECEERSAQVPIHHHPIFRGL